jgi:hypothetical protein
MAETMMLFAGMTMFVDNRIRVSVRPGRLQRTAVLNFIYHANGT